MIIMCNNNDVMKKIDWDIERGEKVKMEGYKIKNTNEQTNKLANEQESDWVTLIISVFNFQFQFSNLNMK